jgi:flagellar hook-associated protein 1 FlgK
MSNGIFGIGLSGLAAAQAGILTAGHNIANVNTPGYSRQSVILGTRAPTFTGSGFVGNGVDVDSVRRIYNDFLGAQTVSATGTSSQLDAYSTELSKLDNLFGDPTTGLGTALSDFFGAVNTVAQQPADLASRQTLLSSAQSLTARLQQQQDQLTSLRDTNNAQIKSSVATINGYASQIADLNHKISVATAAGSGPPNDLLDQRDELVTELNQQVGGTAVAQSDGSYNVFLSNGQALVIGENAQKLVAQPNPDDPQNLEVGLQTGSSVLRFTAATLSGGALGGLLQYRDGALTDAQNALGRIAVTLASSFNDQHKLGLDLKGNFGKDFFTVPAPVVTNSTTNTGSGVVSAQIVDAGSLQASDYQLAYDGSNYTLTRLSDGTVQTFSSLPQTVDGVTIALSGSPAAGDRFLIQPVHYAAGNLKVAITDPAMVAAAGPVITGATSSNVGSGAIGAASVDSTYPGAPLTAPLTLTYSAGTGTFSGFPPTAPVTVTVGTSSTTYAPGVPVPYTAGATISFGGVSFTLSGAPANGDTFTVGPNTNGSGDNRNMQLLAKLATQKLVGNGSSTLSDAYGQLVADVGNRASESQIEQTSQAALLTQTQEAQQQVSGVNLDEEAANLEKYQQAYQAAAKVISIAGTLFDSILNITTT